MRSCRQHAKAHALKRLKRIEGQVRGLARMVEEDRYCIDIVTQIARGARGAAQGRGGSAARSRGALRRAARSRRGNKAEQRRKIAELMDVFGRADR